MRAAGTHAIDLTEDAIANTNGLSAYAPQTLAYLRALMQGTASGSGYAEDLAWSASALDPDEVAVRVEPEGGSAQPLLEGPCHRGIRRGHHEGGGQTRRHLAGKGRPREHRNHAARHHLRENLGHAQRARRLETLGRRKQHGPGRDRGRHRL